MSKPKTIFLDIDGTILYHFGDIEKQVTIPSRVLNGVKEKFVEWDMLGYNIILVTGRRESHREITEKQIKESGLFYDQLIMGIGGGVRVLINDLKPNSEEPTAIAFNLKRNDGISEISI
jgi:hypothetical protein